MNYNSVILVGTVTVTMLWWCVHATRHYPGPKVMGLYIHDDARPLADTVATVTEARDETDDVGVVVKKEVAASDSQES